MINRLNRLQHGPDAGPVTMGKCCACLFVEQTFAVLFVEVPLAHHRWRTLPVAQILTVVGDVRGQFPATTLSVIFSVRETANERLQMFGDVVRAYYNRKF